MRCRLCACESIAARSRPGGRWQILKPPSCGLAATAPCSTIALSCSSLISLRRVPSYSTCSNDRHLSKCQWQYSKLMWIIFWPLRRVRLFGGSLANRILGEWIHILLCAGSEHCRRTWFCVPRRPCDGLSRAGLPDTRAARSGRSEKQLITNTGCSILEPC